MYNLCKFGEAFTSGLVLLILHNIVLTQSKQSRNNVAFSNISPNILNNPNIFLENPNSTYRNQLLNSGQYWENFVFEGSEPGMKHVSSIEHYVPFSYIAEDRGEFDLWPKSWKKHLRSMPKNVLHYITYILYTPKSPSYGELIIPWNSKSMSSSSWNSSAETKILIHDYLQNVTIQHFPLQIKDAYFQMNKTYNIILINWGSIAKEPYFEAALYGDLIGQCIGTILAILWRRGFIQTLFDVHIIGFGMGAHIAGSIGNTLSSKIDARVGRITGLDPVGPGYYDTRDIIRLNYVDADFVDIIHTNGGVNFLGGEIGFIGAVGDADFYPNGGIVQPICENVKPMFDLIPTCDHLKAVDYYKRSILGEVFRACRCDSWGEFDSEACKCDKGLVFMGENLKFTARGKHYLHVFEFTLFEMFKNEQEQQQGEEANNNSTLTNTTSGSINNTNTK